MHVITLGAEGRQSGKRLALGAQALENLGSLEDSSQGLMATQHVPAPKPHRHRWCQAGFREARRNILVPRGSCRDWVHWFGVKAPAPARHMAL